MIQVRSQIAWDLYTMIKLSIEVSAWNSKSRIMRVCVLVVNWLKLPIAHGYKTVVNLIISIVLQIGFEWFKIHRIVRAHKLYGKWMALSVKYTWFQIFECMSIFEHWAQSISISNWEVRDLAFQSFDFAGFCFLPRGNFMILTNEIIHLIFTFHISGERFNFQ